jgi:hypothetical protein
MAAVSITIPDALIPRLAAAMRLRYPEHAALTDAQAFKAVTASFWRQLLTQVEETTAVNTANAAMSAAAVDARTKAQADSAGIG